MARFMAPAKDPHTYVECGYSDYGRFWFRVWLGNDHGPVISEDAFIDTVNELRKATAGYILWTDPRGEAILDRFNQLAVAA
jgi:hypothetical protein